MSLKQKKRKHSSCVYEIVEPSMDSSEGVSAMDILIANITADNVIKPKNYTATKITNQANVIVLDMKKNIQKHISQLQLCNEKLEKMLYGMIQNLEQIVIGTNYTTLWRKRPNSAVGGSAQTLQQ